MIPLLLAYAFIAPTCGHARMAWVLGPGSYVIEGTLDTGEPHTWHSSGSTLRASMPWRLEPGSGLTVSLDGVVLASRVVEEQGPRCIIPSSPIVL